MVHNVVYGAGAFGKLFCEALDYKVDFFIDDFSSQSEYQNIVIKKSTEVPKDIKIYISVLQYSKKIEKELLANGFCNIVNFTDSVFQLPKLLKLIAKQNYLWLVEDKTKMFEKEKLDIVFGLLKDNTSKELLNQIVHLRRTLDVNYYIKPSGTEYFPVDVPVFNNLNIINFIDCGAYTGDTIKELMFQNQKVGYTISFEPDEKNLEKLNNELKNQKESHPQTNFIIYPAGIYSSNTILRFANNGIASSAALDEDSDIQVPVVALDNIVLNSSPNYIKMDIEGAEKEALIGAKKTIQKYKPNLAICLYHKPQDLWELPILIHEIEPSYDMYIRVHEDMCLSTVLYCIPKET
jgi:FkbM family methyltransferase